MENDEKELTPYEKLIKEQEDQGIILCKDHSQINLFNNRLDFTDTISILSNDCPVWQLPVSNTVLSNPIDEAIVNVGLQVPTVVTDNPISTITSIDTGLSFNPAVISYEELEDPKDKEIRDLKETVSEQGEEILELKEMVDELRTASKPKRKTKVKSSMDKEFNKYKKYMKHHKRTCDDIAKDTSLD